LGIYTYKSEDLYKKTKALLIKRPLICFRNKIRGNVRTKQ